MINNDSFKNNQEAFQNLLFNLFCGLSIEDLTEDEKTLLVQHIGWTWKEQLGYE